MSINPGTIIAYREKNKLYLGAILDEKKDKIVILSERNNKETLNKEKIKLHLNKLVNTKIKDHEIAKQIKEVRKSLEKISTQIDLHELYYLLYKEKDDAGYSYKDLSELYFSEGEANENAFAMALALSSNTTYFRLKHENYYPKEEKQVQQELKELEIKKENELIRGEEKEKALKWLGDFIAKDYSKELLPIPIYVKKFIEPLKQYVILRDGFEKKAVAQSLMEEIKEQAKLKLPNNLDGLLAFMIKLELLNKNENINLLKYNIPKHFDENVILEANKIKAFDLNDYKEPIRKDLRDVFTFTIDDSSTLDYDDALSIEIKEDLYTIGVHITDVSSFILPNSRLDKEAFKRRMTLYLPEYTVPLFPERLSEDILSLKSNKTSPTLSFMMTFDKDFSFVEGEICLSLVEVDVNLSYPEVDKIINDKTSNHEVFNLLFNIATTLNKRRVSHGAVDFATPDIKISLDKEEITIRKIERGLKSDTIVKEFMILANHTCSEFCITNNIPAIFFFQEPPSTPIVLNDEIRKNRYTLLEEMKKMRKSEVSTHPTNHFALGLSSYLQSTSPIRRYHDLVVQRQVTTFISHGKPFYSSNDILSIIANTEESIKKIKEIEKESIRFWSLKYIQQELRYNPNRLFQATIIRKLTGAYCAELDDILTETLIFDKDTYIEPGKKILLSIKKVNTLTDSLVGEYSRRDSLYNP